MNNPELTAALRVVLEHLRGTPAVPVPSISLPLAEFQAMQAELLTLRACDGWLRNPAGLAPHARAAAEGEA